MTGVTKLLSEFTQDDWITWRWEEVTAFGDTNRVFLRIGRNTPLEQALMMHVLKDIYIIYGRPTVMALKEQE